MVSVLGGGCAAVLLLGAAVTLDLAGRLAGTAASEVDTFVCTRALVGRLGQWE